MKIKTKYPLMGPSHLPLILLGAVMAAYGLVSAVAGYWLSDQAMRGLITAGVYRSSLTAFEQSAGLVAGLLFIVLFIWCAWQSKGGIRAGFIVGTIASFAPILAGRADTLLFKNLGLRLPAGSVVADALTTLIFTLPMLILFIILASSGRVPTGCRWLAFASIFVLLIIAFFPIYVTVLAFLLKPGDPGVGRMMEVSIQVIKLRYLLPGLSFLLLALISQRFASRQPAPADQ